MIHRKWNSLLFLFFAFTRTSLAESTEDIYEIKVRIKPFYEFKRELMLMNREVQFACNSKQKTSAARAILARMAHENSQRMLKRIADEVVVLEKEKRNAEATARERLKARIKEAEDDLASALDELEALRRKNQDSKEFREQRKKVQRARAVLKVRKEMYTEENVRKIREAIEESAVRNIEALIVISDRYESLSNEARICEAKISDTQIASPYENIPGTRGGGSSPSQETSSEMTPVQVDVRPEATGNAPPAGVEGTKSSDSPLGM
jgi:hypothetical protein